MITVAVVDRARLIKLARLLFVVAIVGSLRWLFAGGDLRLGRGLGVVWAVRRDYVLLHWLASWVYSQWLIGHGAGGVVVGFYSWRL